ncbi:MAG: PAS domain-containing protein [Burkholderiaceae bacterium]|nr:PAS domain-containing protein [Burkholderiaceae bacterium]
MRSDSAPSVSGGTSIPSSLDFLVVGLGASAGGLRALQAFFEAMPAEPGAAFVVVVHLSPTHLSSLPSLLQAKTAMPVTAIEKPMPIEKNHVYVIAPNRLLTMNDDFLQPIEMPPQERGLAIDRFFRSLANVHRNHAVAVVLSGASSDGALGLRAIREQGGLCLVQQPDDAEFDGMPRAAIASGCADWVLPVTGMPARIGELVRTTREIRLPPIDDEAEASAIVEPHAARIAESTLREILLLLRARTGHDFRKYKRATLLRRLERRLQVHGVPTLPAYLQLLQRDTDEAHALLKDLLIGVTNFFRNPEAFDALMHEAIPKIFEQAGDGSVRAWVAGCSSGEEAYSIAILLCEHAATLPYPPRIQVFATDIDEVAIEIARIGQYPAAIEVDVTPVRLRRFFDRDPAGQYRIRKEVREKVMFAPHNLLRDPPFSKLDLICCRNLLIYLDRSIHASVLGGFHFALRPGGYLFLGSSESVDTTAELYAVVDKKHRIFRSTATTRAPRPLPHLDTTPAPARPLAALDAGAPARQHSPGELHRRLVARYAPTVLVDANGNILDVSPQAARYLQVPGGEPSLHLADLVRPELRAELRAAMFQAIAEGRVVHSRSVRVERDGRGYLAGVTARWVGEEDNGTRLLLVAFEEVEEAAGAPVAAAGGEDPVVAHLEEELRRLREQLQTTIEQSDTSTEELKASNEELQAINEELRAATEELETSKEELQSINEELLTVNAELKLKIEEKGKINDDLQNLVSATDIATVFVDRAMTIKRFTPPATRLFNLIPGDVGRSLLDIRHRLHYDSLAADAAEAFQSLRVIEREVGSEDGRWYLARVLPYRTVEDRIDGAVLSFVDITTRRRAEEDVRRLSESARDFAMITVDLEGRITTWNVGAERVFGYAADEVQGRSLSLVFAPADVEQGVFDDEMRIAREEGRASDERWLLRKDGTPIFCSGILAPLYEGPRLCGYGKIARDITLAKKADVARETLLRSESAARAEAQSASEMKDEFLAVMSHELKHPLNLIQLNAELLARLPEAGEIPEVARAAMAIRQSVLGQAQIIDDLLDLSRINTGKLRLQMREFDACDTLRAIVATMAEEAAGKRIALSLDVPDAPLRLEADPIRFEQIVWNLLSNALKFSSEGDRVDVRLAGEGRDVRLDVRDTGAGIEPAMLGRIFGMFVQAEPSSTRRQGGLGVGLAVVRHLVDAHGGSIEAHSEGLGKGSVFTVWLPSKAMPSASPYASAARPSLVGKRVLVVDDDEASAEVLRHLLELEGAGVVQANDAHGALDALRAERFDALVTDIAMPGLDGFQLLSRLRADPGLRDLRVIALTGAGRAADARRSAEAGFDGHLTKPLQLDELLRVLHKVLGASPTP